MPGRALFFCIEKRYINQAIQMAFLVCNPAQILSEKEKRARTIMAVLAYFTIDEDSFFHLQDVLWPKAEKFNFLRSETVWVLLSTTVWFFRNAYKK